MSSTPEDDNHVEPSDAHNENDDSKRKHHVSLRGRWKRTSTVNKMIAIATIVSAASTCTYAVFTYLQWRALNDQITEIKKGSTDTHDLAVAAGRQAAAADTQSKQAIEQTKAMAASLTKTDNLIRATSNLAKESKRSADLSSESLWMARENAQIDQRPWLGVITITTEEGVETADDFSFKQIILTLQNSGKTPALKMRTICCHMSLRRITDPIPDYDVVEADRKSIVAQPPPHDEGVVAPNSTVILSLGTPSVKIAKRVDGGIPSVYYITGEFTYYDMFPGSKQHASKFCLMYRHGKAFTFCTENNGME